MLFWNSRVKKLKVKCTGSLVKNAWLFCRVIGQRPWGQGLGNVLAGNAFRGVRPEGKETPEGCMPSFVKSVDLPRTVGEKKTESVRTKKKGIFLGWLNDDLIQGEQRRGALCSFQQSKIHKLKPRGKKYRPVSHLLNLYLLPKDALFLSLYSDYS